MYKALAFTVPDAFDIVAAVPAVLLLMTTNLPTVPAAVKAETVVVVLDGKVMVD
jgi:hypothetical protein